MKRQPPVMVTFTPRPIREEVARWDQVAVAAVALVVIIAVAYAFLWWAA